MSKITEFYKEAKGLELSQEQKKENRFTYYDMIGFADAYHSKQLTLTDVVKRYRVEAIAINKKELYNEIFESKQKAEELYQVLLIKYYKTYTSVKMTEL